MWDNRGNKRNTKSPDFKCKNSQCGKAVWEQRAHAASAPAPSNGNGASALAPTPPRAPLGPIYAECFDFAKKAVTHYLGDMATADSIVAATATLFIQAVNTGRPIKAVKPAPPPPPPPPPPKPEPEYAEYESQEVPF
jgi:hypothetical protein